MLNVFKNLIFLLGGLFATSGLAAPKIWDGSADVSWYESSAQAYNLINAEQLAGLAKLVNEGVSDFKGKTITLGADIFLNDTTGAGAGLWEKRTHRNWPSIGTKNHPFRGEFDGIAGKKNRKIYGLYGGGLFAYTRDVKISNLDILVGRINAIDNVGSVIGYGENGSITNVHAEVQVAGKNHVGGVVGYFTGSLSKVSVQGSVSGQDSVGGLVGFISGTVSGTAKNNCYFIGNISGRSYVGGVAGRGSSISHTYVEGSVKGDSSYVGGLVGFAGGVVDSSYHIDGDVSGYSYVGGLVGYSTASVLDSYSKGAVEGKNSYVGGLVGLSFYIYKGTSSEQIYSALNSHSLGNVKGAYFVGGLIGKDSLFRYSINSSAKVYKYISNSYSWGTVNGSNYVGGVVGWSADSSSDDKYSRFNILLINKCYHKDGIVSGTSYVGGVTGFTTGTMSNSYPEGDVVGNNFVGGLIGQSFYKYTDSVAMTFDVVANSYSIGNVQGVDFVGGIIGLDSIYRKSSNDEPLKRIIKNVNSQGLVYGKSYVGGVIGKMNYGFYSSSNSTAFSGLLSHCSRSGNDVRGSSFVGGIAGYTYDSLKNSYFEGNVIGSGDYIGGLAGFSGPIDSSYHRNGDVSGSSYIGGLTGSMSGSLENSYSEGNVTGVGNYVGGLSGLLMYKRLSWSSASPLDTAVVKESYSIGSVKGVYFVGGLIGKDSIHKQLQQNHSYNENSKPIFRVISNTFSKGIVQGKKYVGGLIGMQDRGCDSVGFSYRNRIFALIDSSYHKNGMVEGDSSYIGGLVGSTYGSVKKSHSEGTVSGKGDYVGGLLGFLSYNRQSNADTVSIKESYSIGSVKGVYFVGGLIGKDSVHNFYGNTEFTQIISKVYSKGAVEGRKYVGGLIGVQDRLSGTGVNALIDSSFHDGGNVIGDSNYIGGLVGLTYGFVKHSYSIGNIIGHAYVGGLLGRGSVKNSYAKGFVQGASSYVGGLVGRSSIINSSYHIEGDVMGASFVGGLAGYADSITSSHSESDIQGSFDYVGGVAGFVTNVTNSYSKGNVGGKLDRIGGIAGNVNGKIRNSYANGSVRGRNIIGGLAGYIKDSIDVSYFQGDSVVGVYQVGGLAGYAGSAVDSSFSTANVKGDDNVGGLIGSAYGDVSNSYALGNVDGDVDNSSAGNDNLGGLVGYQYSGSVSKSMALGNVTGTTKLGGLVGRFDGTSITQSYANGNVTGGYFGDPADEVGNYYIGGLVGFAKGSIDESYASGIVKGIDDEPVYTGCLVGFVNGSLSVKKSYYDKTKCNLGIDGGENSVLLTGKPDKTTEEMRTQSTFENWDFTDTWMMMESTYPFLQFYVNSLLNAVVLTESLDGIVYDASAKSPLVTNVKLWGVSLYEGDDYSVSYENNVNAGNAKIKVCGLNLYNGCKIIPFEIEPVVIKPTIAAVDNIAYTGYALTPEISAYNGETLLSANEYAVEYEDNINVGTATVTITMKGNFNGTASSTFKIEKATPVISQNPKASDIVIGENLSLSVLTDGKTNVEGEFVWKNPNVKPSLDNGGYAVVFIPKDSENYMNSAEIIVPVNVRDVAYIALHVGGATIDSTVVVKGANYTLPEAPDSIGYDFEGYYNGKILVGKFGEEIVVNENIVLEAIYQIKKFEVTFINGNVKLQSNEVAYGEMPEYVGDVPQKAATAQYTYLFNGWSPELKVVTESVNYTAVFESVLNKYEIRFVNGAETYQSDSVYYGDLPEYKGVEIPTKISTDKYDYVFNGWIPAITSVTGAKTYAAVFSSVLRKYTITFKDGLSTLQTSDVEYGSKPSYTGITPTMASTEKYDYKFKGWNPSLATVTGVASYTAVFDSTLRKYSVTFKNGTTTLQTSEVSYGSKPSYTGNTPTKASTEKYDYTFNGWNPTITTVTGAATYTAVFDSTLRKYAVTFKNGSTPLQTSEASYGSKPSYTGNTPTKASTEKYDYTFNGWNPTITSVTGAATYTAVFDSTLRKYAVTFKNGSTPLQTSEVSYGSKPSYTGNTPTKASTEKYDYTFNGWNPTITSVTGATTYTAVFDSTLRKYAVTFKNGSTLLQTSEVLYGSKPSYTGDSPTKVSAEKYDYTFKGWNPTITSVSGAATYTAVFDSTLRKYIITFKNGSTTLQTSEIAYGSKPSYTGDTPIKASDKYTYKFKGWNPAIATVTKAATYQAVFDSTLRKYAVTFKNGSTTLQTSEIAYGSKPDYTGNTPTKASDKYTYKFKGWNPAIATVTKTATYQAVFDSTLRKYTITFKNGSTTLQTSEVAYGSKPSYTGSTPTKKATSKYTYKFKGWNPAIATVTKAATYQAVFDSTKVTGIIENRFASLDVTVRAVSRSIQISAASKNSAYAVLDMQGRVLLRGHVESSNFNIAVPRAGCYLVRVGNATRKVQVK